MCGTIGTPARLTSRRGPRYTVAMTAHACARAVLLLLALPAAAQTNLVLRNGVQLDHARIARYEAGGWIYLRHDHGAGRYQVTEFSDECRAGLQPWIDAEESRLREASARRAPAPEPEPEAAAPSAEAPAPAPAVEYPFAPESATNKTAPPPDVSPYVAEFRDFLKTRPAMYIGIGIASILALWLLLKMLNALAYISYRSRAPRREDVDGAYVEAMHRHAERLASDETAGGVIPFKEQKKEARRRKGSG